MNLSKILKNVFLVIIFGLAITACATKKTVKTTTETTTTKAAETQKADPIEKLDALMQGDVYVGPSSITPLAPRVRSDVRTPKYACDLGMISGLFLFNFNAALIPASKP